ncbi:MAG: type II toxin-antitoxin system MqsA family antitoxin [Gammaproteobacteria bacterium]|nr:type II toxin-antitoxin system MqsA family antitoxin [Gammaproteobacteria bacterium]
MRENNCPVCPVCAEGNLHTVVSTKEIEYGDSLITVDGLLHSVCEVCGAEVTGLEESRVNKRLIIEARKRAGQFESGADIKTLRVRYGVTQKQAAKIFGGGLVAFSKYESDDLVQSIPMDRLLKVAGAVPEAMEWLANYAGVELKRKHVKQGKMLKYRSDFASGGVKLGKKIAAVQAVMPIRFFNQYAELNDSYYEPKSNIA